MSGSGIGHARKEAPPRHGNPATMAENALPSATEPKDTYRQLLILGLAVLSAAAVVVWLVLRSDDRSVPPPRAGAGPALVSRAELERLPESVRHAVYWAGPKDGFSYELTRTGNGRIFVRYLPTGVAAGDPHPGFLTVGTYPRPGSFADLRRAANGPG